MRNIEFNNNSKVNDYKNEILGELEKKEINYSFLGLSPYNKNDKAYELYNENTVFLNNKGLLVFGEKIFGDKKTTFKLTLYDFLKQYNLLKNKIYIYRDGNIIECFKKDKKYYDKNGKKIKIYFGDIISSNSEFFNQLISINKIEQNIGFIKIKKIYKICKFYLLKVQTLYDKKLVDVIYDNTTNRLWLFNGKINNIFYENISFYKSFNETIKYFEGVNMFDEPINERVLQNGEREQLDGNLRFVAIQALKKGEKYFEYRGVKYPMFIKGKPNIPQVCIDFVLDFYEKLHDSYYDDKGNHPDKLNFEKIFGGFYKRRRLRYVIKAIKNNINDVNKYFTLKEIPDNLQISYNMGEKIINVIKDEISKIVHIGDILVIKGPLDDGKIHYHSCLVVNITQNNDIIIEENTNYPHKETLIRVLSRTPKRKLTYIIRPTKKLLTVK